MEKLIKLYMNELKRFHSATLSSERFYQQGKLDAIKMLMEFEYEKDLEKLIQKLENSVDKE